MHDKIRTESQLVRFTALLQEKIKENMLLLPFWVTVALMMMELWQFFYIKKINKTLGIILRNGQAFKKKKSSVLIFSLTWKVETCSSEGLFCPMKVQCLCEMLICASFGLVKRKKNTRETRLTADGWRRVRAGRKNDDEEAARWIGMYRRGWEPPVNFPLTITEGK